MGLRKLDYIFLSLILLLFLVVIFLMFKYFQEQRSECIANPLTYAAKKMTEDYGYKFIGTGYFQVPMGYSSPRITFNSTNVNIQK